jgi:hypothetical protein
MKRRENEGRYINQSMENVDTNSREEKNEDWRKLCYKLTHPGGNVKE